MKTVLEIGAAWTVLSGLVAWAFCRWCCIQREADGRDEMDA